MCLKTLFGKHILLGMCMWERERKVIFMFTELWKANCTHMIVSQTDTHLSTEKKNPTCKDYIGTHMITRAENTEVQQNCWR